MRTQWPFLAAFASIALALHAGWETAHAVAYVETDLPLPQRFLHCVPMAVLDTAWSGAVVFVAVLAARRLRRPFLMWGLAAGIGVVSAVLLEMFALATDRWTYNELMPIVPALGVGLWPVLQMAVLPPLALFLAVEYGRLPASRSAGSR